MAYSDVKLDSDEKKGVASDAVSTGLGTSLSGASLGLAIATSPGASAAFGSKLGLAAGPAGALLGAGIGLAVGGVIKAVGASRQAKAEKQLAQDIAKQQKAARADQVAINRSSQARQELRDRKSQQYMFQPEDEVFLNATGGGSGYDRFMRSKYGA
jgi:hypothetical protein